MSDDLTPRMVDALWDLYERGQRTGKRWHVARGERIHRGALYGLVRRGLVTLNGYYDRAALTDAGREMFEVES